MFRDRPTLDIQGLNFTLNTTILMIFILSLTEKVSSMKIIVFSLATFSRKCEIQLWSAFALLQVIHSLSHSDWSILCV
jgi:hypothetical protein